MIARAMEGWACGGFRFRCKFMFKDTLARGARAGGHRLMNLLLGES